MDKTIEFLRDYNRWRRGAEIPQPNPTEIGIAINTLIEEYIKLSNEKDAIFSEILDLIVSSAASARTKSVLIGAYFSIFLMTVFFAISSKYLDHGEYGLLYDWLVFLA